MQLMLSIVLVLLSYVCSTAFAAEHYVISGGSGNGSSWDSAMDDLPSTLIRGDTYFIGDGVYSDYTFNTSESGTDTITIIKATEGNHGTDVGWDSSYGDGQAIFTMDSPAVGGRVWLFTTGYYIINGQTGTDDNGESYGFKLYNTAELNDIQLIRFDSLPSHIEISYVNLQGLGADDDYGCLAQHLLHPGGSNHTFSHLFAHDSNACLVRFTNMSDSIFEHCYFSRNHSVDACHSEGFQFYGMTFDISNISKGNPTMITTDTAHGMSSGTIVTILTVSGMTEINGVTKEATVLSPTEFTISVDSTGYSNYTSGGKVTYSKNANIIVRDNVFWDIEGTGFIVLSGSGHEIYNNFFGYSESFDDNVGNGVVCAGTNNRTSNIVIANNTFTAIKTVNTKSGIGLNVGGVFTTNGNVAWNNLWYDCISVAISGINTQDYNGFISSTGTFNVNSHDIVDDVNPFSVSYQLNPDTAISLIDAGADLSAYFTTDITGYTRPYGAAWDIGAYEWRPIHGKSTATMQCNFGSQ